MEASGAMNTFDDLLLSTVSYSIVFCLACHTLDNATDIASVRTGSGLAPEYFWGCNWRSASYWGRSQFTGYS